MSLIRAFWFSSKNGEMKEDGMVSSDLMMMPKYMGAMGFRDIEIENLAILARQAWWILQDPMSLSAWVLKVVYFSTALKCCSRKQTVTDMEGNIKWTMRQSVIFLLTMSLRETSGRGPAL
jgi:hypothetical protein